MIIDCVDRQDVRAKTVYIAPIKLDTIHDVTHYLSCFGEVDLFRVYSRDDFHYGFVQFTTIDAAKILLSRSRHYIPNSTFKAKVADLFDHVDYKSLSINPSLLSPDQNSDSNILNALDDDCMREIFANLTDMVDLSNAAEVCVRFNQHAQEKFTKKHESSVILNSKFKSVKAIETVLRNFGPSMVTLGIDGRILKLNSQWMNVIQQYDMPNLRTLGLVSVKFKRTFNSKIHSKFAKLQRLFMTRCDITNSKGLLSSCKELNELELWDCSGDRRCLGQCLPQLEEVNLGSNKSLHEDEMNKEFEEIAEFVIPKSEFCNLCD